MSLSMFLVILFLDVLNHVLQWRLGLERRTSLGFQFGLLKMDLLAVYEHGL